LPEGPQQRATDSVECQAEIGAIGVVTVRLSRRSRRAIGYFPAAPLKMAVIS
jgi:hypothetical protein